MALRSVSSDSVSGYHEGSGNIHDYNRQTTVNDAGFPVLPRESRARTLVRRPSVDFAKLTKQRSRAIIDNYFRRTSPPVLEHMSKEILDKISNTELGKLDLREARRQLTDRRLQLHDEVKRKGRFSSEHHRIKWAHKRGRKAAAYKPAVDDVNEVQSNVVDSYSDSNTVNNVTSTSAHMTTATHTDTTTLSDDHTMNSSTTKYRANSKPVLNVPHNPFDQAFAEAEIDSPHRRTQKSLQMHTKSHSDATKRTSRRREVLESSKSEEKEKVDDEGLGSSEVQEHNQNTMLISKAELSTSAECDNDDGADEVDFSTVEQATVTDDDKDILNRAQNITLSSVSEILMNVSACSSETSSSGFVHCELATTESITVTTSIGIPGDTSVNSHDLHLNLSCDRNGDDMSQDEGEDDEQPRSKVPVPETPLDVDGPLPSKFHDIPQFAEVQQFFGRIPTFAEYMAYRLDAISKDIGSRYPDLDKHIQQIIGALGGTLTYELFHRAAMNVQSQARQVYEGMFMVLRFGRQLFHNFPETASNFTTQWVNEYIVYQGGWDAVTDRYFEEQQMILSPVTAAEMTAAEMTGASGESGDGGLQMDIPDGGTLAYVVKSDCSNNASYPAPSCKKPVNMSPPVWDLAQRPMFTNLERACSVEFLPSVPEVAPDPEIVSPTEHHEPHHNNDVTLMPQATEDSLTKSLSSLKSLGHSSDQPSGTGLALSKRTLCPIRRTNSAPQLSNIPSPSSSSSLSPSPPPPELLEKRRGSLQDYNDVFLSYIPYFPIALPSAAVAIHLAFDLAQRLSSS